MIDALRSYLQLASGVAEVSATRAKDAATAFVSHGVDSGVKAPEDLSRQLQTIAGDLLEQSKTNREILVGVVKTEVERAVGRMGFVREEELAAVRQHVHRLEARITALTGLAEAAGSAVNEAAGSAVNAVTTGAASVATAARSATAVGTAPATTQAPAKPAAPRKAAAKKPAAPRKAAAKKPAAPRKAAAKKPAAPIVTLATD